MQMSQLWSSSLPIAQLEEVPSWSEPRASRLLPRRIIPRDFWGQREVAVARSGRNFSTTRYGNLVPTQSGIPRPRALEFLFQVLKHPDEALRLCAPLDSSKVIKRRMEWHRWVAPSMEEPEAVARRARQVLDLMKITSVQVLALTDIFKRDVELVFEFVLGERIAECTYNEVLAKYFQRKKATPLTRAAQLVLGVEGLPPQDEAAATPETEAMIEQSPDIESPFDSEQSAEWGAAGSAEEPQPEPESSLIQADNNSLISGTSGKQPINGPAQFRRILQMFGPGALADRPVACCPQMRYAGMDVEEELLASPTPSESVSSVLGASRDYWTQERPEERPVVARREDFPVEPVAEVATAPVIVSNRLPTARNPPHRVVVDVTTDGNLDAPVTIVINLRHGRPAGGSVRFE